MRTLLASLSALPALALAAGFLAAPGLRAQEARPTGVLSAIGQGEVERAPDLARIYVAVTNRGDSVSAVVSANRTATEGALAAIGRLGVAREDVRTANFQVYETPDEYDRDGALRPQPPFAATHQIEVVLRDVARAGEFAGEILALEGMTFQSIGWDLERRDEAQSEALRRAVADARRQADALAEAAGVRLGPIVRIGEPGQDHPRPMTEMSARALAAPAAPIVPPATLTYAASVRVEWAIAQPD